MMRWSGTPRPIEDTTDTHRQPARNHRRKPETKEDDMATRKWSEMGGAQKFGTVAGGIVQFVLATLAWSDLAHRPAKKVNGPKGIWAAVISINYAGPIAYFIAGRKD
jgi:hypothetical protein